MTTLIERARAFATIADYLPEERRTEIAKELADQIQRPATKTTLAGAREAVIADANQLDGHVNIATWLAEQHAFEGARLVRATAILSRMFAAKWQTARPYRLKPPQGFAPMDPDGLRLLQLVYEQGVLEGKFTVEYRPVIAA